MYKYTLYNDDCIVDTTKNLLIYKGESKWNEFESWKKNNPNEHQSILIEKEKILRWNGGYPLIVDGCEYYYDVSGSLLEVRCEDFVEYYDDDEVLYKRVLGTIDNRLKTIEINKDNQIWRTTNHTISHTIQYDTVADVINNTTMHRGNFVQKITYQNGNPSYSTLFKEKSLLKETKYFDYTNKVRSVLKRNNNCFQYHEYYLDTNIRARGTLNLKKEMHGKWEFYHQNGFIESKYFFENGLAQSVKLYNERGELYKEINS